MDRDKHLVQVLLRGWTINNGINIALIKMLPSGIWSQKVPGYPQKTVRMMVAHIHNIRCRWIKATGREWKIPVPDPVDPQRVTSRQLIAALNKSSRIMLQLFQKGLEQNGRIPRWRHGVILFMQYMITHEAHHRGQLLMVARQLGYPLAEEASDRLWQFSRYYSSRD